MRAVLVPLIGVGLSAALLCGCERNASPAAPAASVTAAAPAFDPVTMDAPPSIDHPASMDGIPFTSAGATLNGVIYEASGAGPHPTVVLLHGFPGNEQNLDLAQALRRAGWNVVGFHYRATWGSGGEFSFTHVAEDSVAVVAQIREPAFATAHRIDREHVSVLGHSMGGYAALATGAAVADLRCTVAMAPANFGALGQKLAADPALQAQTAQLFTAWGSGPIRDISGAALVAELLASPDTFDMTRRAQALAIKPLLLIAANQDTVTPPAQNHEPLMAAITAVGSTRLHELRLNDDHAFSGQRIALAHAVLDFLEGNCR